ncbi:MAG: DUF2007 domain-containing protein [Gammaproteobacteria bacterium]|nr:DUF2007 domain-containing protein [Gammaproteobacteria bacterium]
MPIIYRSGDIAEAHIIRGMLEAGGITAYVGGHYLQGGVGEIMATDFASIHVDNADVAKAIRLLAEYDKNLVTEPDLATAPDEDSQQDSESGEMLAQSPMLPIVFMTVIAAMVVFVLYYLASWRAG